MKRSTLLIALVGVPILALGITLFARTPQPTAPIATNQTNTVINTEPTSPSDTVEKTPEPAAEPTEQPEPESEPKPEPKPSDAIATLKVPFASQAPFSDWSDPRQQDGCEEASIFMAWHWINGTTFTTTEALRGILALSRYSEETFKTFHDTSAIDTAKMLTDFYGYAAVTVRRDITTDDIRDELAKGNLVLIPADGTKLGNPNFKQPGPPEHMLVIKGYDAAKDQFITNDPGTRLGEGYRYSTAAIARSLRDYPTGFKDPNPNPRTAMIIVRPK